MITNYFKRCLYNLGSLTNRIYLFPNNTTFGYNVDNESPDDGDSYINSIVCDKFDIINVDYATYNETTSIDERFELTNTLTVRLNQTSGLFHNDILEELYANDYYIGFESTMGDIFILSTEYFPEISYTYNLAQEQYYLQINFAVNSNFPSLVYTGALSSVLLDKTYNQRLCEYQKFNAKRLRLANFNSIAILGNTVMIDREDALKEIEFINNSVSLTQTVENETITNTLTFSIPFEEYIFHLHYNLLEFTENTYTALLYTEMGRVITLENLFPSYTIQTSEDESTYNTIQITLTNTVTLNKDNIGINNVDEDDIEIIVNETKYYSPVETYDACINETTKAHLLIEIFNFKQKPMNEYLCLEGYESMFENSYNIVGTYTADDTSLGITISWPSAECGNECQVDNMPSIIYFFGLQTKTYEVNAVCPYTSDTVHGFNITPLEGAGILTITFENILDETRTEDYVLEFNNGAEQHVKLIVYSTDDFIYRFVEDGTICLAEEYTGTNECVKWETTDDILCVNGNKYEKQIKYISPYCNGDFKETTEYRTGTLLEENSDECLDKNCESTLIEVDGEFICELSTNCEEWREVPYSDGDKNTYICNGKDKYHIEQLYIDSACNNNYIAQEEFRQGELIEQNSPDCGGFNCDGSYDFLEFTFNGGMIPYVLSEKTYTTTESPFKHTFDEIGYVNLSNPPYVNARNMFNYTFNGGGKLLTFDNFPYPIQLGMCYGMFAGQDELTSVNLSCLDITRLNDCSYMFQNCSSLQTIDLSGWSKANGQIDYIQNIQYMFDGCTSLTQINMINCSNSIIQNIKNALFEAGILDNVLIKTIV